MLYPCVIEDVIPGESEDVWCPGPWVRVKWYPGNIYEHADEVQEPTSIVSGHFVTEMLNSQVGEYVIDDLPTWQVCAQSFKYNHHG